MTVPVVEAPTSYSTAWDVFLTNAGRGGSKVSVGGARGLPAVSRALQTITGMAKQMPLDDYRGADPRPRPAFMDNPDPDRNLPWFLDQHVTDYLLNGNAVHYVTSRNAQGYPASAMWLPAHAMTVTVQPGDSLPTYWFQGTELRYEDVVHVQRGADPWNLWRGVGVVEQHVAALGKIADQEAYETDVMRSSAVPSVVITTPNAEISQAEADNAKSSWMEKYGTGQRVPAVLPKGTTVVPLAWSPHDAQLAEVRKLSLVDVAAMFNLDGYWLSAPTSSMTYRSPGPLYLNLLRQSVNPILVELEAKWSQAWLPLGRRVVFDRSVVLRDDLSTTITSMAQATAAGLYTVEEARTYLGLPSAYPAGHTVRKPAAPEPKADPADDPEGEQQDAAS